MVAIYGKETLVCSRNALCREPRHTQNVKRTSDQLLVRYNFRPTRSHCNALQSVLAQTSAPHKLLDWLQQQDPVAETQALMVDVTASISGRCLRVKSDTPPDAPLLSVPLSIVFEDQEVSCPSAKVYIARHNSCTHCQTSDGTRQAAEG